MSSNKEDSGAQEEWQKAAHSGNTTEEATYYQASQVRNSRESYLRPMGGSTQESSPQSGSQPLHALPDTDNLRLRSASQGKKISYLYPESSRKSGLHVKDNLNHPFQEPPISLPPPPICQIVPPYPFNQPRPSPASTSHQGNNLDNAPASTILRHQKHIGIPTPVEYRGGAKLIRRAAEKLKAQLRTKEQKRELEAKQNAEDNVMLEMDFGMRPTLEGVEFDSTGRARAKRSLHERILTRTMGGEKIGRIKGLSIAEADEKRRRDKEGVKSTVDEGDFEAVRGRRKSEETVEELPDEHGFVRVPVTGAGPSSSNRTRTPRHSDRVDESKKLGQKEEQEIFHR